MEPACNVKEFWNRIGSVEPHFGVLTDARFKQANIGANSSLFWNSGSEDVSRFENMLRTSLGCTDFREFLRGRPVADIGSGVGRIASAIAPLCGRVYCVDIAQSYLDSLPANDKFVKVLAQNDEPRLPIARECRLVYSVITFQHNPPEKIKILVKKACDILADDGVALLHIPCACKFDHRVRDEPIMQMNFLPESDIRDAAMSSACCVVDKHPMDSCGKSFVDYMYVITRKPRVL